MRNVTGRENLITSRQTNELAHALWILVPLRKLYGRQNRIRQHYATLLGSKQAMESWAGPGNEARSMSLKINIHEIYQKCVILEIWSKIQNFDFGNWTGISKFGLRAPRIP